MAAAVAPRPLGAVQIYVYNARTATWESLNVGDVAALSELAEQTDVLKYPETITATVVAGSAADTQVTEQFPIPSGKALYITYLKLTTPSEATGNILISTSDSTDKPLLADDQAAESAKTYDVFAIWGRWIRATALKVRATASTTTSADRTVILEFSGFLVNKKF